MKLTKKQAKALFNKGGLITFVPSKCDRQSMVATYGSNASYDTFEDACLDKEYYYCNKMNGLKLAFYGNT